MSARQGHGFDYEKSAVRSLGLTPSTKYLSANDAYFMDTGDVLTPIQTKCIKLGSPIDMGSYEHNKGRTTSFGLVVGFWETAKNNIVEEHVLFPPIDWWRGLFQTDITFDSDMSSFIKGASNDRSYDKEWGRRCKDFLVRWCDTWSYFRPDFEQQWGIQCPDRVILPRFKRDHKKQKRVQCAIPNAQFYKYFIQW